ncbi:hypothetical protein Tco_0344344 [Tanacetum coccineum]
MEEGGLTIYPDERLMHCEEVKRMVQLGQKQQRRRDDLYNNLRAYELEVKGCLAQVQAHKTWLLCPLQITTPVALISSNTAHDLSTYHGGTLQQIYPDDMEEIDLRWQMAMSKVGVLQLPQEGHVARSVELHVREKSRQQEQGKLNKECACGNIYFHSFGVM